MCFVWNDGPLMFLDAERARNMTPDKLYKADRDQLFPLCDQMLQEIAGHLDPEIVVGVGAFAEGRAKAALPSRTTGRILHPSPASPKANKGWAPQAEAELEALGLGDLWPDD